MTLTIRNNQIHDVEKMDRAMSFFICLYLLLNAVNSAIQNAFAISESGYVIVRIAIQILLIFFMIRPIMHFSQREWNVLLLWELLALLCYIYSWLLGVSISRLQGWAITTLGTCVPLGVFAYLISDKKILYNTLLKFSWFILAVLVVEMSGRIDETYNMHFSYALLFVILLHSNELIGFSKRIFIVPVIVECLMLMAYGSRGALLCVAVFFVIKIFTSVNGVKRYLFSILVILLFGGIYFTIQFFGREIYGFLVSHGYGSRTWRLLLLGDFVSHDSGRNEIWNIVLECIKKKPVQGWGIYGAVSQIGAPYPHQLFLDLLLTFGVPIGSILSIAAIRPAFRVFTVSKGMHKDLMIIFLCSGLISLMFSGTVFTSYYYFLFLGLGLSKYYIEYYEGKLI